MCVDCPCIVHCKSRARDTIGARSHAHFLALFEESTRHLLLRCDQDLRWNEVGDVGAEALFHVLHHNKTIRDLRLAGNKVASLYQSSEGHFYLSGKSMGPFYSASSTFPLY